MVSRMTDRFTGLGIRAKQAAIKEIGLSLEFRARLGSGVAVWMPLAWVLLFLSTFFCLMTCRFWSKWATGSGSLSCALLDKLGIDELLGQETHAKSLG